MRYSEFKLNESIINEINMSPSNLENLTKGIDAKIGIEFEFVMQVDEQDIADFPDQTATNIRNVMYFFEDDFGMNDETVIDELAEKLTEEYNEWSETAIETYMNNPDKEYSKKQILRSYFYIGKAEEIRQELKQKITDKTGYEEKTPEFNNIYKWHVSMSDGRRDRVSNDEVLPQVERTTNSKEIGLKDYYEIRKPIYDKIDEKIEEYLNGNTIPEKRSLDNHLRSEITKRAASELQFLEENYPMMSDVYDAFGDDIDGLIWPQQKTEYELDDILAEFRMAVGNNYEIETDSSIVTDDENDIAVEIKTDGALPLEQALNELRNASDFIRLNGYTNDSTGLHINVSVPNFSRTDLDYVKLVLLLGDTYLLRMFNRFGNTYARSSFEEIKAVGGDDERVLTELQNDLNSVASRIINNGWTDKYSTVNVHSNRIEFRSPGGDWIEDQDIEFIISSIRRMVVVLDAALDPTKYQKEYAKKLYKFLQPYSGFNDITKIFSMRNSGLITNKQMVQNINKLRKSRPVANDIYWIYGDKNLQYLWGSGKTKSEAFEDSRQEILDFIEFAPNIKQAWNEEMRNNKFFPTNRETHETIQAGGTTGIKYDSKSKLYYIKN